VSRAHLLDASALIALALTDHEHHEAAATWVTDVERLALCPVVEGALVRFLVRLGQPVQVATSYLGSLHATGRFDFWPDDLSYRDAGMAHVRGHRQVTDAYLVALAARRDGVLATFDQALARTLPAATVLIA